MIRLTAVADASEVATDGDGDLYVIAAGRLFRLSGSRWVDGGPGTDLASPAG